MPVDNLATSIRRKGDEVIEQMYKRVAIYIRVSSTGQAEDGYSLEAQEHTLRQYCEQRGYKVVRVYEDRGLSGKDIKHRPGMLELLEAAKLREFDIVLVWKLTRFTRSLSDLCRTCDMLDRYQITFMSYTESFDCSTPSGRMMRNILGVIAQWEREVIAENVRAAMDERVRQGWITFSYALGYDVHRTYAQTSAGKRKIESERVTINKPEAAIVKFIRRSYLDVQRIRDVVMMCLDNGYRGKNGQPLTKQAVYKILTCPLYSGYMSWRGIPFKSDKIPAFVSVHEHNEVQRVLDMRGMRDGRPRLHPLIYLPE